MGGPEKVYRKTCAPCQWQGMPEECADCPAKMAYDCVDERNARIYYTEARHLHCLLYTSDAADD